MYCIVLTSTISTITIITIITTGDTTAAGEYYTINKDGKFAACGDSYQYSGRVEGAALSALKTADAGYLTRRLHDVSQDVVVNEFDCGTLRGIEVTALKKNEEIVETLGERILGRVALNDIIDPSTNEVIIEGGNLI